MLVRIIDLDQMARAGGLDPDPTLAEVRREARDRLERVATPVGASGEHERGLNFERPPAMAIVFATFMPTETVR